MTNPGDGPELHPPDLALLEVQRDLRDLVRDVGSLRRLIWDGNGQQPLTTRLALLEKTVADFSEVLHEVRAAIDQRMVETFKGRSQLIATIITGLLALTSATISAMIAMHKH